MELREEKEIERERKRRVIVRENGPLHEYYM